MLTINDLRILLSSNAVSFFGEYLANFTKSALLNTSLKLAIVSSEIFILLFFFKRLILSINWVVVLSAAEISISFSR